MAPTKLLDLPDEILEIVVHKLIESLGTLSDRKFDLRFVQPIFPGRPFGDRGLVSLRQTCRRMRNLVDATSMQSISMMLCSDHSVSNKRALNRFGGHPFCGGLQEGPASGSHSALCWHILWPGSKLASRVKSLSLDFCYDSTGYDDYVDEVRIKRVETQFGRVMKILSPFVHSLQIGISQMYMDDQEYEGRAAVPHTGISKPIPCPAMRSLRLNDASLYYFLPVLALEAPMLRL